MPKPRVKHNADEYRSGLEDVISKSLKDAGVSFSYEALTIPFTPTKVRHYKPDFIILHNGVIVETKGWFVSADRSKHLTVREQHPDLDIRFVFSNPANRIGKKSKTTYGDWCRMKGFKYAKERIPAAWLAEPPNAASLMAIAVLTAEAAAAKKKGKKK